MHETFVFPMDCTGLLQRWDETVEFIDTKKGTAMLGRSKNLLEWYDPFEFDNLIPDFIKMIERVLNGDELEKCIEKWLFEWGPLHSDYSEDTVESFWSECLKFYKLWTFYRDIANKNEQSVYEKIHLETDNNVNYKITFFPHDDSFPRGHEKTGEKLFWQPKLDLKYTFSMRVENEKDLFEEIQFHAMMFLLKQAEEYTSRANLYWGTMRHETNADKSTFKIKPVLQVENLIDAIYLQLYILLSENEKKICPVCNKPFLPERKDQKYCPTLIPGKESSCKLTAKSRRYRARKASNT